MIEKLLADVANGTLRQLVDQLADAPGKPVVVVAKDRKRKLQVVVTVASYVPMTLDAATLDRIREMNEWPDETVSLAPEVAAAS